MVLTCTQRNLYNHINIPVSDYCSLFAQTPVEIWGKIRPLRLIASWAVLNANISLRAWLIHLSSSNGRRERWQILNNSSPLTGIKLKLPRLKIVLVIDILQSQCIHAVVSNPPDSKGCRRVFLRSGFDVYVHKQTKKKKKLIITGRLKSMWTPSMRLETKKKGKREP